MARKIYETDEDRAREDAVLSVLRKAWHPVVIESLPRKYALDALVNFGTTRAWVEVKVRDNPRLKYPTYMLSLHKVTEGMMHYHLYGNNFLLVVQWTDGLYYVSVPEVVTDCQIEVGGRTDRGDDQDVEPCLMIPVSLFQQIIVDNTA